jgi:two-component sensor histidine kinase
MADLNLPVFEGGMLRMEFGITGLRGTRRWLETQATPLRDGQRNIIAALNVTRDITNRKKTAFSSDLVGDEVRQLTEHQEKVREVSASPDSVNAGLAEALEEALTNVARHAVAARVWVRLQERHDSLILDVEDDGRGLEADSVSRQGSFGLIVIRERTRLSSISAREAQVR